MSFVIFQIPKSLEIQRHLTSIHIDVWLKEDVFLLRWWLLLGLIFIFLFAWYNLLDKSRLPEIILYTALSTIVVLGIVEYGEELTLWDYPTDIIPIFPPLTSINLISLPLTYSIIYQYFNTKKSFIWASILATAILCFIIEPLLSLSGLYQLLHWKYYFSFPLYLLQAFLVRKVVLRICKTTKKYKNI